MATIAHELGHERLLGESRIDPARRDGEPLTDLFTVFFGLGIFSANAAFEYSQSHRGYQTSRLGYLTEAMYGYTLARYAWLPGRPRALMRTAGRALAADSLNARITSRAYCADAANMREPLWCDASPCAGRDW